MKKIFLLIMLCATGIVSAAETGSGRMFGKYTTKAWVEEITKQVQEIMKKTSYSAKATAPSRKPKSSARKKTVSRRKKIAEILIY